MCHASKDISSALGFSASQLMEDLSTKLWDVIIPEPFLQLHRVNMDVSCCIRDIRAALDNIRQTGQGGRRCSCTGSTWT